MEIDQSRNKIRICGVWFPIKEYYNLGAVVNNCSEQQIFFELMYNERPLPIKPTTFSYSVDIEYGVTFDIKRNK